MLSAESRLFPPLSSFDITARGRAVILLFYHGTTHAYADARARVVIPALKKKNTNEY